MTGRRQKWVILLPSYNCLPSLMFLKPKVLYYHHKGMPWNSIWSSNFNESWTNLIHIFSSTEQLEQTKNCTYCFGTRP
jgi:hypothetical protein